MKRFVYCGIIFVFCSAPALYAQDFHLSQYDAAPLYLNPAMTGLINGNFRIHTHYRTQWKTVASKPFRTAAISYDMPVKQFAFGAQLMDNRAGAGNFNVFSFLVSGGYDLALDENKHHHVSLGIQGGILQKSVDISKLTWDNQYVYTNGGGFNPSLSSGENFTNQSVTLPDLNLGAIYYFAGESSLLNPFFGFAAMHITQPDESFLGVESKLPLRYVWHGGVKINLSQNFQLLPKFFKLDQVNNNELTFSLLGHAYLKSFDAFLIFGPTLRNYLTKDLVEVNKDAAILQCGVKYSSYTLMISYDVNTSSLKPVSNGRGGFEISFTYTPSKLKANPVPTCPRM